LQISGHQKEIALNFYNKSTINSFIAIIYRHQLFKRDLKNLFSTMVDIDFSDIQEKYTINVPETFDNVVVVDNLPIVDSSKESKLIAVVKKIFKNIGVIEDNGIYMPKGDDEKSKGYCLF
jgi:hypothetical protein